MIPALEPLFAYLDKLTDRAPLAELKAVVEGLSVGPEDLAPHLHFSEDYYTHNLVQAGEWYSVMAICWKNGQRSPIHNHTGSTCVIRVLRGTMTETHFNFAPNGQVKALDSQDHEPGSVSGGFNAFLHQVSNLQAGDADLVTLHIYSPPLVRMETFSLTDAKRGEEIWLERRKVVQEFPENSETPRATVHGWVTPNPLFFVRNHFPVPTVNRDAWRMSVEGCVARPLELKWEDVVRLPERSVFSHDGMRGQRPIIPGGKSSRRAMGRGRGWPCGMDGAFAPSCPTAGRPETRSSGNLLHRR